MRKHNRLFALALLFTTACSDVENHDHDHDHHDHDHNHGLPTQLVLHFTPVGGGDTLTFAWSDPMNDGNPVIDDIVLPNATDHDHHHAQEYLVELEVWNQLEDPAEEVTPEILELSEEHQFFFTGSAVEGPATLANDDAVILHAYEDSDKNGLPLGHESSITTLGFGTGELTVTLRHLPTENGEPTKVEGLEADVAEGGFAAIGGDNDIQATFKLTVN